MKANPFIEVVGIVTTPAAPAGKQKVLKNTHTYEWAKLNNIAVFTPEDLFEASPKDVLGMLKPDFFVVAGYGKLLPTEWLSYPTISSINLHFSLLPDYKGSNPAEWAILLGEVETGVTMITMSEEFDKGNIITRLTHPISDEDTRDSLYEPLYELAATMASETIPSLETVAFADPQEKSDKPDAMKFTRAYGFIDWQFIQSALEGHMVKDPTSLLSKNLKTAWEYLEAHPNETDGLITPEVFVERAVRALSGFPGVWTYLPTKFGKKRLKILSTTLDEGILTLDTVQLEGKTPSTFIQIKNILTE
jgi:methionyl-tRNA formyltransferase